MSKARTWVLPRPLLIDRRIMVPGIYFVGGFWELGQKVFVSTYLYPLLGSR